VPSNATIIAKENRAGQIKPQMGGYSAFLPSPLPPDPPVKMDSELWTILSKADRALGRLDGATENLPNPDLFVLMYVRKEAVLSSQIEGTQASLLDVLEVEAQAFDPRKPSDVAEVVNYVNAMNYGLKILNELPVSNRLIKQIHERLLEGVRGSELNPGSFRTDQNWIGVTGTNIGSAAFIPPPPSEVENCMGELERFFHADINLPILIKVGLIHYQFETIHPFLDGNGRVGRLLITFLLCEKEILKKPLLYISHFFKKNRLEYYDRLQSVRDAGDFEGWLKFFLRGVADVSNEATEVSRNIAQLREQHRQLISERLGRAAHNGLNVLEHLYQDPIIHVRNVEKWTETTYANANNLVSKLEEIGVLTEISGRARNRVFCYDSYVSIFRDD